ncbi:MAG: YlmH/Sll1252 family protein [Peptoniphilaceae bacterium]|nr:YlmH/Sll1252 family protein [Peptoniphilaceae bacterium]MDY6019585.1 YlmH/Sll1252 family protein [Anaerococcus sp.]
MKLEYNIDFIQDKNKKSSIKKAISILERAFYNGQELKSYFLDPFEQSVIKAIGFSNKIDIKFIGGNEDTERKIFIANPHGQIVSDAYIKVMEFECKALKHPDVLGALIHLGLDRESIGDILIKDNKCEFVVLKEDANFVKYNLTKIKNQSVSVDFKRNNILSKVPLSYEENKGFVSSLRLDAIISQLTNLSRNKVKSMIKSKDVKLNYVNTTDPSKVIKEGSIISIKHQGRFIFDSIEGMSKKGNYLIKYRKYK